ncbi:MAG: hypothetical protein KIT54_10755 [Phycisphaeraceae bacterium]|nr:hypothetical protein [Phycisphaeraceae bacterium]
MARRTLAILLCVLLPALACMSGCASRPARAQADPVAGTSRFVIPASDYGQAFEIVRQELIRLRYQIDRADAHAGVIQTHPALGAGLLAPWTLGPGSRVVEDTLNVQSRLVEVRFEAAEVLDILPRGPASLADPDLSPGPMRAADSVVVSVRVLVLRRVTPTRRLEPTALRLSSNSIKPELFQRGLSGRFDAPTDLDPDAARTLAGNFERRLLDRAGGRNAQGRASNQGGPGMHAQLAVQ